MPSIYKDIPELNNEIVLIDDYIKSAKGRVIQSIFLMTGGVLGAVLFVVDHFALQWEGVAPYVKMLMLLGFIGLFLWGISLKSLGGVKVQESSLVSDMVTQSEGGYRNVAQLEIELRRVREAKKKKMAEDIDVDNAEARRKSYKEDATLYVEELRKESEYYRKVSNIAQGVIIACSLLGSFLAAGSYFVREYSVIVAVNSLAIGLASGFSGYWKYKERSFYAQQTADQIEHEIESFNLEVGRYKEGDSDGNLLSFSREILKLKQDQKMREQNLDQPSSGGEESSK